MGRFDDQPQPLVDPAELPIGLLQLFGPGPDKLLQLSLIGLVFPHQAGSIQGPFDGVAEDGKVFQGLQQVIIGPQMQRFNGIGNDPRAGNNDHRGCRNSRLDLMQHLDPIDQGHPEIHQHQVRMFAKEEIQSEATVFRFDHLIIEVFQVVPEALPNQGFVIDHQDFGALATGAGRGSRTISRIHRRLPG